MFRLAALYISLVLQADYEGSSPTVRASLIVALTVLFYLRLPSGRAEHLAGGVFRFVRSQMDEQIGH